MKDEDAKTKIKFQDRSPVGKGIYVIWFSFKTLFISVILSILIEFFVMRFWHPEQGSRHSAYLLEQEVKYLSDNFKSVVFFGDTSAGLSTNASNRVYEWMFVSTGFERFDRRFNRPIVSSERFIVKKTKSIYRNIRPYAIATVNIVQLFIVRLVVILMSLTAFILITYAAAVDGIVQRDLRRYHGSIEQSWIHHYTKSWLGGPIVVLPAMLYLALPFNTPPALVFMPSFVFFGLMIFIMITTYKKFA